MKKFLKALALIMAVIFAMSIALAGCGSQQAATDTAKKEEPKQEAAKEEPKKETKKLKFAYVSKMLTNPWFVQEEWGIKQKCQELNIDYIGIDANLKDEACMQAVDNAIAQGIDGLMITVTNQGLGPAVVKKCQEAKIPLITLDDTIKDEAGNPIPHVGLPTKEIGMMGGEALAKLAKERNFFAAGNVVKVLMLDIAALSVVHERTEGYMEALKKNLPELKAEDFLVVDTKDGMFEADLAAASSAFNANPKVTHWIITGINDDCAAAALKILEENKFDFKNVIACGLGGYELSLNIFKKGGPQAESYITSGLQPHVEGIKAVEALNDFILNKKEMPKYTAVGGKIVTKDNYLEFFPNGKLVHQQ